ncbi:hypothetical protein VNO78_04572 [Psophocarpus tetragonolobus]|uniref:DUF7086 domain-containing protein n=1 Tax=Psophocarpus tetragonolobus TaxID=3891 RepID=A0AAN9T362_PSOTE
MQDPEDFLTLSTPGNPSKRARVSPPSPINPPQTTESSQVSYISPLLPPSNHNVGGDTTLSLTAPLLTPYNTNNVGDNINNVPAPVPVHALSRSRRARTLQAKSETIVPPFPWSTNQRATVHSHKYLLQNKIHMITGSVRCKRCDEKFEMELDLESKLSELLKFIQKKKGIMHDRAPMAWVEPVLPKCHHCGRDNSVEPILSDTKKKAINWLFLLLAQMLGCCTIKQLKYFCKHTNNHRTGAKDRLVYSTYMGLCKQLLPDLFD